MNSKKLVSIITSVATVFMTTGAAFMPAAAGAQIYCGVPTVQYVTNFEGSSAFYLNGDNNVYVIDKYGSGTTTWNPEGNIQSYAAMAAAFNASQTIHVRIDSSSDSGLPDNAKYVTLLTASTTCVTPPSVCAGSFLTKWGTTGTADGQFTSPWGIDTDAAGNVYVANYSGLQEVQKFSPSGAFIMNLAANSSGARDVAVDEVNNLVYVLEPGVANRVRIYDASTGLEVNSFTDPGTYMQMNSARAIAVNGALGEVYIANAGGTAGISVSNLAGTYLRRLVFPPGTPSDLQIDSSGNILMASLYPEVILKYSPAGTLLATIPVGSPTGFGLDAADNIFVASGPLNNITQYDSSGTQMAQWGSAGTGNGQFNTPAAVAVFGSTVYVSDNGNARVQAFSCVVVPTPTPPTGDYKDILTFSLQTVGSGPATFEAVQASKILRVYDTDDSAFRAAYGTTPAQWRTKLNLIYEAEVGLVTWCETDNDGACTAFKSAAGNYLAVGRYDDSATSKSVYVSRQELASDFNADLENFADLKVIKSVKESGITYGPGGQVLVTPIAVASSNAGGTLVVAILILAAGLGLGAYLIPKMRK